MNIFLNFAGLCHLQTKSGVKYRQPIFFFLVGGGGLPLKPVRIDHFPSPSRKAPAVQCRWPWRCMGWFMVVHGGSWWMVYIYIYINGCFLKWWYLQNTPKWSCLVGKPMVVGHHHFRKHPYMWIQYAYTYWISIVLMEEILHCLGCKRIW